MIPVPAEAVRNIKSAVADNMAGMGENMRFFIDTAEVEEIKKARDMGIICGVILNSSLIAGGGRAAGEAIAEIAPLVDGPVSCEINAATLDAEDMIAEGRNIAAVHPNAVVKIPMTAEGMKACSVLTAEGIKVNVAMMFSANQALQAARAGAAYVSPFSGRLNDVNQRGLDLIREIADLFSVCEADTQIIATNVRNSACATECGQAGADIAAVPYAVIEQMPRQPMADAGIAVSHEAHKATIIV